ncbi:IS110 family transposase [Calothrix rhizosoleniae]
MTKKLPKILGIDVSKASVSCCLLESRPENPREFYYTYPFDKFNADSVGVKALLALTPDIAILEPTGTNYSKIWISHLDRAGVEVKLVGHRELKNYRSYQLNLPDKDDDADALALACYGFDYATDKLRFVRRRHPTIQRVRELILRLNHLNRVQSPIINRARQDLAWQFPEIANTRSIRSPNKDTPLMWGWLAGIRKSNHYDRKYANSCGLGITGTVRWHAQRICSIEQEQHAIEIELSELLIQPIFKPYQRVFDDFGFGLRLRCTILSQIFPLGDFLTADGQPEIKRLRGRVSGKPTKRHLSLRRFQKALGVAPSQESSGDSQKIKIVGGSAICRRSLWQWVFTRVEVRKSRMTNKIGVLLGEYLDTQKREGRPVQLVRSRTTARAVKLLFPRLVNELNCDGRLE